MVNFPSILEVAKYLSSICAFLKKKLTRKLNFLTNNTCTVPFVEYFCREFADSMALRGTPAPLISATDTGQGPLFIVLQRVVVNFYGKVECQRSYIFTALSYD